MNEKPRVLTVKSVNLMKEILRKDIDYLDYFCGVKPSKFDETKSVFLFNYNDDISNMIYQYKTRRRAEKNYEIESNNKPSTDLNFGD